MFVFLYSHKSRFLLYFSLYFLKNGWFSQKVTTTTEACAIPCVVPPLYHADEELMLPLQSFSPSQTIFRNFDVFALSSKCERPLLAFQESCGRLPRCWGVPKPPPSLSAKRPTSTPSPSSFMRSSCARDPSGWGTTFTWTQKVGKLPRPYQNLIETLPRPYCDLIETLLRPSRD